MIWVLFKDRTKYNLLESRITVIRQVKVCIDELVDKEMSSSTQVEQDDFKVVVEQFVI